MVRAVCLLMVLGLTACSSTQDLDEEGVTTEEETTEQPESEGLNEEMLGLIQAPGKIPMTPEVHVGWAAVQRADYGGGQGTSQSFAVVGETDTHWHVEHTNPLLGQMAQSEPLLQDALYGLKVAKETGIVEHAVVGRAGERGQVVGINTAMDLTAPPAPTGEVRQEGTQDVAGVEVAWRELRAAGQTVWVTDDPVIVWAFGGVLKREGGGLVQEVVQVQRDASPALRWE